MADITAANLAKLCQRVSGHAIKIAIDGATPEDISKVLVNQNVLHRVADANDPTVFDDKMPTIVTGVEDLSETGFVCFISKMDNLRFRDVLIFPTRLWFEAEECELSFGQRMNPIVIEKFRNRVAVLDLEGF